MSLTRPAAASSDAGKGAAGKWTDAATGEHGDLLDLIALNRGLDHLRDALDEARFFLSLPRSDPGADERQAHTNLPRGSRRSVRRLYAMSEPIAGTIAASYLRARGITSLPIGSPLRFHPRCYYRPHADSATETWPALIAAVTDLDGRITGAHRTWLDPSGRGKAPFDSPRRAMGHLLGHGVRFGVANDVVAAGEGIETMLSLHSVMPAMPMVAALSANHLAALLFPPSLSRLYIARDGDLAGDIAMARLNERAEGAGIEARTLSPTLGDFNEDLRHLGLDHLRASLRTQLAPEDVGRFLELAMTATG
jgi:hypothetical protein